MKGYLRIASYIAAVVAASLPPSVSAFNIPSKPISRVSSASSLYSNPTPSIEATSSRRSFIATITTAFLATTTSTLLPKAALASSTKEALITDLSTSLDKISTIPPLLLQSEWDKVRTILKTPPVNSLWNLGESQNTLVKLAKETGDYDLLELKDELAISLQMTDQYSYDNVFIYYQPGNGKVKVKEPMEMAEKAIGQLREALEVASR